MTNTTIWSDITSTERDFGVSEGKYFINEEGKVRTASKKLKKVVYDVRGREMVVLDTDTGNSVAIYISDILTAVFGKEDVDNFNERALESARVSGNGPKKPRTIIRNVDTGKEFNGFAAAARSIGMNYDKFYNAFYTGSKTTAIIEGITFEIVA